MSFHLYPALITCLALLLYVWTIAAVAMARGRYKIEAPAVAGHPAFERTFRIQQNTVEQLVLFLPSLWIFSLEVSQLWAGIIGFVFVIARLVYILGYERNPAARGPGFTVGFAASLVLLLAGLAGTLKIMLTGVPF